MAVLTLARTAARLDISQAAASLSFALRLIRAAKFPRESNGARMRGGNMAEKSVEESCSTNAEQ